MNQQVLLNIGGRVEHKYYENSILKIPTSALITVYDNEGTELVSQIVADIETDGTMYYTVLSGVCDDALYNGKLEWEFVVDGATKYAVNFFDIIKYKIINPVINSDIINRAPFVKEMNYRKIQMANGGTDITIECNELLEDDDYWTSGIVDIVEGTNIHEQRRVISFSNKILTVDSAFSQPIDNTSKFVVVRSFDKEISEAFAKFESDLSGMNIQINKIIDNTQIKEYIIILTLYIICINFSKDIADIWFEKARMYKNEYDNKINKATFTYDDSGDGNIDASEINQSVGQVNGVR